MLYDNPQFVAAVRKIISDSLKPSFEPQEAQQYPDDESRDVPIATVSELRTQVPIRVQTKPDDGKAERIWKWAKGILEVVGIFAVIAYTVLANKQLHQMRKANDFAYQSFLAINRPFVGLDSIVMQHAAKGPKGEIIYSPVRTAKTGAMAILSTIKNAGPLPGTNFTATQQMFLDGQPLPMKHLEVTPYTIFPGQTKTMPGWFVEDYFPVVNGTKKFWIEVNVTYNGPMAHYAECRREEYNHDLNMFVSMGACVSIPH